jgi:NitT/TauT family transport system substrate-binding protein
VPAAAGAPASANPDTVKVSVAGTFAEAAIYIGEERGYFRDQGIRQEFITLDSAARAIPALSTGEIDVAAGVPSAGLYNAVLRDIGLKVVVPQSVHVDNHSSVFLLVRQDLLDGGAIRTPADLRGKQIALPSRDSVNEYVLEILLRRYGLTTADVELVQLGLPDFGPAFAGKTIDAGVGAEPTATIFVDQGLAAKWLTLPEMVDGSFQFTYLVFAPTFANQRTDVARRWMTAYLKGTRDWQRMIDAGEGREDIFAILSKHTAIRDRAMFDKLGFSLLSTNGDIDRDNLRAQAAWYRERGLIPQEPTMEQLVDARFVEAALQQLGRY